MDKRIVRAASAAALVLALAVAVSAQGQQAPPTWEQVALRRWNDVHKKMIDMAKDFPEDKFDARPHKDSRSFIEEIWHVTQTCEFGAAIFRGEQPDPNKYFASYEGRPRARAELVAQLEKAVSEGATLLQQKPTPRSIGLIEHAGEHYGKLVTIYRINGLVPPVSREQN